MEMEVEVEPEERLQSALAPKEQQEVTEMAAVAVLEVVVAPVEATNGIPRKWIASASMTPYASRRTHCAAGVPSRNRCATTGAAGRSPATLRAAGQAVPPAAAVPAA